MGCRGGNRPKGSKAWIWFGKGSLLCRIVDLTYIEGSQTRSCFTIVSDMFHLCKLARYWSSAPGAMGVWSVLIRVSAYNLWLIRRACN